MGSWTIIGDAKAGVVLAIDFQKKLLYLVIAGRIAVSNGVIWELCGCETWDVSMRRYRSGSKVKAEPWQRKRTPEGHGDVVIDDVIINDIINNIVIEVVRIDDIVIVRLDQLGRNVVVVFVPINKNGISLLGEHGVRGMFPKEVMFGGGVWYGLMI